MSADGLWYIPEGFREGARANTTSADAAETTRQLLGRVQVSATSYGGATEFVNALIETRDTSAQGAARAAEGRQNMAAADNQVADTGEEMDAAAAQALGAASTRVQADQTIADGLA
ncbi:hypothetical protein [Streptomyces litchfieldiae]|uniref:Uncharacterized protein n=1 Tax=Streptomyces litchfieldiae TaxID=3075543 RepID=A0ABU2MI81_9ACTN|nr:hypothetical protein [Streptomyces sp. DSM 44938]MDT0341286.1 hypothetical protein [Streptomyces sp. DSM 44938]